MKKTLFIAKATVTVLLAFTIVVLSILPAYAFTRNCFAGNALSESVLKSTVRNIVKSKGVSAGIDYLATSKNCEWFNLKHWTAKNHCWNHAKETVSCLFDCTGFGSGDTYSSVTPSSGWEKVTAASKSGTSATANQFKSDMFNYAVPGDVIVMSNGSSKHTVVVWKNDGTTFTMYQSGRTGGAPTTPKPSDLTGTESTNAQWVDSVSFSSSSSLPGGIGSIINGSSGCGYTLLHFKNYPTHAHSYNSNGVCTDCGYWNGSCKSKKEYTWSLEVTSAAVEHLEGPYGECPTTRSLSKGTIVYPTEKIVNNVGNVWYKLTDGYYIYSDYVSEVVGPVSCTHDWVFQFYEEAHPHRNYYICSKCQAKKLEGSNHLSSCSECKGHTCSYGSWFIVSPATCTQTGTEKRTCSGCGCSETRTVSPLGHNMTTEVIAPTITSKGYTVHTCTRNCGYSYIDSYVSQTGGELYIDPMGGVYDNGNKYTERTIYSGIAGHTTGFGTVTKTGYNFAGWAVIDNPSNGEQGSFAPYGKPLNNDPQFTGSTGDVSVYNNTGNGNVTIKSVVATPDSKMTSGHMLKITTSGPATPGLGGYYTIVDSKYNGLFYCILVAKIPEGYTLENHNNTLPDGTTMEWLTPTKGTGDFEVYILKIQCGSSGITGSFGHFAINGPEATPSNPVSWYLSYSCIFDATDVPQDEGYIFTFGKTTTYVFALWQPCTNHNYISSVTKEASCTDTGVMTYTCSCGESYTEDIPMLGHTFSDEYDEGCDRCEYKRSSPDAPEAPVAEQISQTSITLSYTDGYEYSMDGIAWQTSNVFVNLSPNTEYTFYQRVAETSANCVSEKSNAITVTTHNISTDYDENAPQIIIGNYIVHAGNTVEVPIILKNSDTLKSIALSNITYDTENLELVGGEWTIEDAVLSNVDIEKGTAVIGFENNIDCNGMFFTLTFKVKDDVPDGDYSVYCDITAKRKEKYGEISYSIVTVPGNITVTSIITGDVDGDNEVTSDDAVYLLYYTLLPDLYPINQDGDFDGSGEVDSDDAVYLLYYTLLPEIYPLL